MSADMGRVVSRIAKNKAETLVVRLVEFHGRPCLDLRVFFEGDEGTDVPSKKGVAISTRLIPDLIAALREAEGLATKNEGRAA